MGDRVATALHVLQGALQFIAGPGPGRFGLMLIPLGVLGLLTVLAARMPR
jgi:hypothetical protein